MNRINEMSDEELLAKAAEARRAAWDAPKSDTGNPSYAWARTSREWMTLANEIDRRGLKQPDIKPTDRPA
jgi:hypothetical protein